MCVNDLPLDRSGMLETWRGLLRDLNLKTNSLPDRHGVGAIAGGAVEDFGPNRIVAGRNLGIATQGAVDSLGSLSALVRSEWCAAVDQLERGNLTRDRRVPGRG